jgi:hypothetical protein
MTSVEERARQLLDAARTGHNPSAVDAERVRAGLRARVLAEPMLIEPGLPVPRPGGLAAKLLVAFVAGGSAGFAAGFVVAQAVTGTALPASAPQAPSVTVSAPSASAESTSAEHEQGVRARALNERDLRAGEAAGVAGNGAAPNGAAGMPIAPARRASPPRATDSRRSERVSADGVDSASALKAELDGLRRAQELLYRGDAAWALARLDELDRAQGSSLLLEERTATRVIAECVLGKGSSARVSEFARQFPNSAHLERVRASCQTNGNDPVVSPVPSGRANTERD